MQVQGVVISVSLETDVKKNGGGTYKGWELVYKGTDGDVRTEAKPVTGLRYNAALKKGLESLAQGDEFTLVKEKNAQTGFYDVKSIEKGFSNVDPQPEAQAGRSAPVKSSSPNTTYQQRDFESKDERTAKQLFIIRQSSISAAIGTLSVGAKTAPSSKDVLSLAAEYVDFVYGMNARDRAEQAVIDIESDVPY
jgi:hypothetical protein